jgi:cysteine desulfuration protein SufE
MSPFGSTITAEEVLDNLSFFDSWEDRYRYIIDLGKQLPPIDDSLKTEDRLVRGCQSQVWLEPEFQNGTLTFKVDSDAHIVRGLLAIVMSAYNGKTPKAILDFDIEDFFAKIDLIKHLSPTRGNGLRAMVQKIRQIAEDHLRKEAQ